MSRAKRRGQRCGGSRGGGCCRRRLASRRARTWRAPPRGGRSLAGRGGWRDARGRQPRRRRRRRRPRPRRRPGRSLRPWWGGVGEQTTTLPSRGRQVGVHSTVQRSSSRRWLGKRATEVLSKTGASCGVRGVGIKTISRRSAARPSCTVHVGGTRHTGQVVCPGEWARSGPRARGSRADLLARLFARRSVAAEPPTHPHCTPMRDGGGAPRDRLRATASRRVRIRGERLWTAAVLGMCALRQGHAATALLSTARASAVAASGRPCVIRSSVSSPRPVRTTNGGICGSSWLLMAEFRAVDARRRHRPRGRWHGSCVRWPAGGTVQ